VQTPPVTQNHFHPSANQTIDQRIVAYVAFALCDEHTHRTHDVYVIFLACSQWQRNRER